MAPNITESIYFLGLQDNLVGRTEYCNYPAEAESVAIVGSFINMNYENIIKLSPDLIIFSGNLTLNEKMFLEEKNIPYADIKIESVNDIIESLNQIEFLISQKHESKKTDILKEEIENIKPEFKGRVYIEAGNKPIVSAGANSYIGSILAKMGYELMADDGESPYTMISQEKIIKFNPEIILLMHGGENLCERIGWSGVSAVKNKKVYEFSLNEIDILSRSGPRVPEAVEILRRISEKASK